MPHDDPWPPDQQHLRDQVLSGIPLVRREGPPLDVKRMLQYRADDQEPAVTTDPQRLNEIRERARECYRTVWDQSDILRVLVRNDVPWLLWQLTEAHRLNDEAVLVLADRDARNTQLEQARRRAVHLEQELAAAEQRTADAGIARDHLLAELRSALDDLSDEMGRADTAEAKLQAVRDYANILARGTGTIPAGDAAWKLRQILGDPNGVPDAPVVAHADVRLRGRRKSVADAKRSLYSRIIASAHLLDAPFSNAPEQSPWTGIKRAMADLDAALAALDTPTTQDPQNTHGCGTQMAPCETCRDLFCPRCQDQGPHWHHATGGIVRRGPHLIGETNPEDTCKPGDPDPTYRRPRCNAAHPDGIPLECTRSPHRTGQHVRGDTVKVTHVWPDQQDTGNAQPCGNHSRRGLICDQPSGHHWDHRVSADGKCIATWPNLSGGQ